MNGLSALDLSGRFGYMTSGEIGLLQEYIRLLDKEPIIVNIGAGAGTSALAIWESREDINTVYTVDITLESSPFGCLEGEKNAMIEAGIWGVVNHKQIHGDSSKMGYHWAYKEIRVDMVFVDGDHSYWGCFDDLVSWYKVLKESNKGDRKKYIAVHDVGSKHWPEVNNAIMDFILENLKSCKKVNQVDTLVIIEVVV